MRIHNIIGLILAGFVALFGQKAATEDGCAFKAAEIIRQAYLGLYEFSENGFLLNGRDDPNGPKVQTANIACPR